MLGLVADPSTRATVAAPSTVTRPVGRGPSAAPATETAIAKGARAITTVGSNVALTVGSARPHDCGLVVTVPDGQTVASNVAPAKRVLVMSAPVRSAASSRAWDRSAPARCAP